MPEAGEDLEVRASAGGGCAAHVVGASADGQGGKHSTRPGRRLAAGGWQVLAQPCPGRLRGAAVKLQHALPRHLVTSAGQDLRDVPGTPIEVR